MQPKCSTDIGHPSSKRTKRIYNRLPLQTQGQTSILYIFYFNIDCVAEGKSFDIAYRVMDFMRDYNLKPSDALIKEYRQSKTTKTLNRFPSLEDWRKIGMWKSTYDELKEAYRRK